MKIETDNLDALDLDDLIQVRSALRTLFDYSTHKMRAMRLRSYGRVQEALRQEYLCDLLYRSLPDWAKSW